MRPVWGPLSRDVEALAIAIRAILQQLPQRDINVAPLAYDQQVNGKRITKTKPDKYIGLMKQIYIQKSDRQII